MDLGNAPLALLMAGERSAGSLARELSRDVRWVHYRLGRLCAAGLIRVGREERRTGKYYEAVGRAYRVPFSLTDATTLRELIASLYTPFLRSLLCGMASSLAARDARTLALTLGEDGSLRLGFDATASGTSFGTWAALSLSPRRASALRPVSSPCTRSSACFPRRRARGPTSWA